MQVARIDLMGLNTTNPVAYASLTHGAQWSDPVISRCQLRIDHLLADLAQAGERRRLVAFHMPREADDICD